MWRLTQRNTEQKQRNPSYGNLKHQADTANWMLHITRSTHTNTHNTTPQRIATLRNRHITHTAPPTSRNTDLLEGARVIGEGVECERLRRQGAEGPSRGAQPQRRRTRRYRTHDRRQHVRSKNTQNFPASSVMYLRRPASGRQLHRRRFPGYYNKYYYSTQ